VTLPGHAAPPETAENRRRRRLTQVGLVALAALTLAVAGYALTRETEPPALATDDVTAAAAALALTPDGRTALRWTGDPGCDRGLEPDSTRLETATIEQDQPIRWSDAGAIPLAVVDSLTTGPAATLAFGRGSDCLPAYATRRAGGPWTKSEGDRLFVHAAIGADGSRWELRRPDTGTTLARATTPDGKAEPLTQPCEQADGLPVLVAPIDAKAAWLLCQGPSPVNRLLLRTRDGGRTWERRVDARPQSGLDGSATITSLAIGAGPKALALLRRGTCPEGELRASSDEALTFQRQPCLSVTVRVGQVLDVALDTTTGAALALATSGGDVITIASRDAGTTWTTG
jgi:hypothetical protein